MVEIMETIIQIYQNISTIYLNLEVIQFLFSKISTEWFLWPRIMNPIHNHYGNVDASNSKTNTEYYLFRITLIYTEMPLKKRWVCHIQIRQSGVVQSLRHTQTFQGAFAPEITDPDIVNIDHSTL